MPRDGSGIYSKANASFSAGTTIESGKVNGNFDDLVTDANAARPVTAGGTGGSSQIAGWNGLTTKGTDVATASTINLTTATGPYVDITGTITVTAVTLANNTWRIARATGIFQITASASLIVNKSTSVNYTTAVGDMLIFTAQGGVTSVTAIGSSSSSSTNTGATPVNLGLAASVATNALTISLKGVDGNDPSASNPVVIPFRNVTAATGTPTYLTVTAATSLVISSGSTMGMTNGVAATLAIVGFNDAGTFRLGLVNPRTLPLTDGIASSTAEGGAGAADSAGVIYTGTAVTSKAMTVLGYATVTEATAGTWATAPATLKVDGAAAVNNALPHALCRAWVNFNGTGTIAIRGSLNVSSLTDNGVGDYTINFTNAMADANYAVVATTANVQASGAAVTAGIATAATGGAASAMTASAVRITTQNDASAQTDTAYVQAAVFR